MVSNTTKLWVGIFVLSGTFILLAAILWLSTSHFYKKGKLYAAYFDESIQGLEVGSTVKYRGISVGRVRSINIAENSRYIEVIMEINNDFTLPKNTVAQLKSVGITGFIYIEFDLMEESEKGGILIPDFTTKYEVIPTIKSDIGQILQSISEITKEFKSIKVSEMADNINDILETIQDALKEIPVAQLSKRLDSVLKTMNTRLTETKSLIQNLDTTIIENRKNLSKLLNEWSKVANNLNDFAEMGKGMLQKNRENIENFPEELTTILKKLEYNLDSMNKFIEELKDQPSLIFSNPPERSMLK
jgi:phospholipid/cholesterol/gamma-HCH transport system substrate-binding protein